MSSFRIRSIDPFVGNQIILWLEDEQSHATGPDGNSSEWCVRLTIDEARTKIAELFDAYAQVMQNVAIEVAAGGCRTCGNDRQMRDGSPCPVCIPRAESRIRTAAHLRPKQP